MITQPFKLNLIPGGVPVRVPVSQYDAGSRNITFSLYQGETAFSVPAGAVVTCDGAKPDRKGFSYVVTASGSAVTVTVTEQMTAVPGEAECQITIRKDGKVLGSANFLLAVEHAALPDGADISETEISTFVQIANQTAEAAQNAKETADTLDGKKAALDESTAAAITANSKLTATTSSANTARSNLTAATTAANAAKGNLETATTAANTTKTALEQPTQDALTAKTALDTANDTAESNLEALNNSAAMAQKIPKVSPAVAGNLPVLTATGELDDSGKKPGDFAPGGYGLGESAATEYDSMIGSGFIYSGSGQPDSNGAWGYQVQYTDAYGSQVVCAYDGTRRQRVKSQGVIGTWEFDNPPMYVGIEYRTTERHNGKVVYAKLVDFGALPNASTKNVAFSSTSVHVISLNLAISDGSVISAGVGYDHMYSTTKSILVGNTTTNIRVITQDNMTSLTATAIVKYTK